MKMSKQNLSIIGLVFITFLAAIQYVFLQNVPDTVSTFSFVCITNVIGFLILGAARFKKILNLQKSTLKKGIFFAIELTGFNVFTLLGSKNMDSVIISSVISLYFVFITPILLLLKKKVNFFSAIATVIAIIALILMFGADITALANASMDVIFLVIADVFFAAYVVSVSILGEGEDSLQLSFSQMLFGAIFALVGWIVECAMGNATFALPKETSFWVSALFIGVCIRAVYGLVQITCQKYVPALQASLIFAAEIVITLIMNPIMCTIFGTPYTRATVFQIIGAVLFVIATLMADDGLMDRFGYEDLMDDTTYETQDGTVIKRNSMGKKMILFTLTFTLFTLIISTVINFAAIGIIRNSAISNSTLLGEEASETSSTAMIGQLEQSILAQSGDKARLADEKLKAYADTAAFAASYATALYKRPDQYPKREVKAPNAKNAGKWTMQQTIAAPEVDMDDIHDDNLLLGNMEDVFKSIVEKNTSIATIYMGTRDGLMVSYDKDSDSAVEIDYYEFRERDWYNDGKEYGEPFFTDTYQDSYGRGLTITCAAPFYDGNGEFMGTIGIDILMEELNQSLVNEGVTEPSFAMLIDDSGNYIAGPGIDPTAEEMGSIYDGNVDPALKMVGAEILQKKNGILKTDDTDEARYIAYSGVSATGWIICIFSPVSEVMKPAVAIRESIDQNTAGVVDAVARGILIIIQSVLVLTAVILLFVSLRTGNEAKKLTGPLKKLTEDVGYISGGNLDYRSSIESNDEIGDLARAFNNMTDSLQEYIDNVQKVTAEKERIGTELSVATNIQADMLPRIFPPYPERADIRLYGTMDPAKEVGGDFYDFFLIDNDHIALVMADVSGKGVPAALFMVIGKTILKNNLQSGMSVEQALISTNNQLAENNDEMLFITAWACVVDLNTGEAEFSDAGHEYAIVVHKDGQIEEIRPAKKVIPLAAMEDTVYRKEYFRIERNDKLFLYTDGVPEATDANNKLYKMERLEEVLAQHCQDSPEGIIKAVKEDVDRFVGEAPQFDDLTMLCFERE